MSRATSRRRLRYRILYEDEDLLIINLRGCQSIPANDISRRGLWPNAVVLASQRDRGVAFCFRRGTAWTRIASRVVLIGKDLPARVLSRHSHISKRRCLLGGWYGGARAPDNHMDDGGRAECAGSGCINQLRCWSATPCAPCCRNGRRPKSGCA